MTKRPKLPKTYFGFPVAENWEKPRVSEKTRKHRGVALIIAIFAVAMIMIFSSNIIVNSQVNLERAMTSRDNLKAEYMAKSGFNLALFLLLFDFGFDMFQYKVTQGNTPVLDTKGDIWAMLNGLPIGGDTAELLASMTEAFGLSEVNDGGVLEILKEFDGSFVINIEDENSKINISKCQVDGRCSDVVAMLTALFNCPVEKEFLEVKGLDPNEMVQRIKDWVDEAQTTEGSGFSREDDPYEKQIPPYRAKNVPMESVAELNLIEGWDDEMHKVFSPYITIYPFPKTKEEASKVNLNTADRALLGCLLPDAKLDCNEKFQLSLAQRSRTGGGLVSSKDEINKVLSDVFCNGTGETTSVDPESSKARDDWFGTRSTTFRVKVEGQVDFKTKTLETVIERRVPDDKKKELTSYKILYWRMI